MDNDLVLYRRDGKVGFVSLNRPAKLNAINGALEHRLVEVLEEADRDPETSVVVLRGEGRSFCAGYDMAAEREERAAWAGDITKWHAYLGRCLEFEMMPWRMRKPVVASVQGHALGGGCELAMFCDLTLAAENARFGEPEVRFSRVGPGIVMPWIIGLKKARELLYFGDLVDAPTALAFGMINRVVPADELETATLAYAQRLSLIAPETLVMTKLAIRRGADAAGFVAAMNSGLDACAPLYAQDSEVGREFRRLVNDEGLGAALKWRHGQFEGA